MNQMTRKIELEVDNCVKCPYCRYECDALVFVYCANNKNAILARDFKYDEKIEHVAIPDWCPLTVIE